MTISLKRSPDLKKRPAVIPNHIKKTRINRQLLPVINIEKKTTVSKYHCPVSPARKVIMAFAGAV
jgi:hypothetical protein